MSIKQTTSPLHNVRYENFLKKSTISSVVIPKRQSGFTLIELLCVIAIIGILSAIAVPVFFDQRRKASIATMKSDVSTVRTGLDAYYVRSNSYGPEEVIAENGGAIGEALSTFVFRSSPRNTVTTLHDDATASYCIIVNNKTASTVVTYGQGKGTIAIGCTAGYSITNETTGTTSTTQAPSNTVIVTGPIKSTSPVCTGPANIQAKRNVGCPGF